MDSAKEFEKWNKENKLRDNWTPTIGHVEYERQSAFKAGWDARDRELSARHAEEVLAAVAAAVENAARFLEAKAATEHDKEEKLYILKNYGHASIARELEKLYTTLAKEIRALKTPARTAALDKLLEEARREMRDEWANQLQDMGYTIAAVAIRTLPLMADTQGKVEADGG